MRQLPRRRRAATISAQIYYTPTLDSVIVTVALPAATAAPPSSRQSAHSLVRVGTDRGPVGRTRSSKSNTLFDFTVFTDEQLENAFRITNV